MKRLLATAVMGLWAALALAQPQPTAADYLAQGPSPWAPAAVDAARWQPDFVVAADGSGTHRSVQAAVDAVPAGGERRWFIRIQPGTYRGALCVKAKAPLTLYGSPGNPRAVTLVDGRFNGLPKRAGIDAAQPCHPNLAAATHGTSGSATAIVASADVMLAHLTIANDATETQAPAEGGQAVALMTMADRVQLEGVRLVSRQDTFYAKRPAPTEPARVFVRGSVIEGDVDFVFGNATLVVDDSTLVSRAGRGARGGYVLAPSTPAAVPLGFLVQRSRFVAEPGVAPASVALARAWDEAVPPGQWQEGRSPNGQALVRDSALGPHIAQASPWAASTSRRPYSERGNRFAQRDNIALPADIAREALPAGDGWAAAAGGTRGGAEAAPDDVHTVRNRQQLAAALDARHDRPRIVKVQGRLDLSVDDAGQPLGADDYRDPAFSWAAYATAFDPATWGREPPKGPLEDARAASARNQAARVVLRVPSRTTLVGIGPDAQIVNGMLFIDGARDVIVRNIVFSDPYDHFPAWDPKDGAHGEWNSEYDAITLRRASHVWIDHCSFDDGTRPDGAEPLLFGRRLQRHDGLLDITRGSSFVTVSWNRFAHHAKTSLVGGGDRHTDDEGRLKVTYHHNLWQDTRERSPRVRYGQVHLFNNLHVVDDEAGFGYGIGVGHRSAIVAQHNVFETPATLPSRRLVRLLGGSRFSDEGSLHNGRGVSLLGELRAANPGATIDTVDPVTDWKPTWLPAGGIDPATEVAARVRAGAGAGRLWVANPTP
jgi:pectate lyase/pectin methylesterase-like acyl-CoA thioesterase